MNLTTMLKIKNDDTRSLEEVTSLYQSLGYSKFRFKSRGEDLWLICRA